MRTHEIVYSPSTKRFYVNKVIWYSKEISKTVRTGFLSLFLKTKITKETHYWHNEENIFSTIYWDEALKHYNDYPKTQKQSLYDLPKVEGIQLFMLASKYKYNSKGIEILSSDSQWYLVKTGTKKELDDFVEKIEQEKQETVLSEDDKYFAVSIDVETLSMLMKSDFERPQSLPNEFIDEKVEELKRNSQMLEEDSQHELMNFPIGINVFTGKTQMFSARNLIIGGGIGSGKTNLIHWLIECLNDTADFLILDVKGEFIKSQSENIQVFSECNGNLDSFLSTLNERIELGKKSFGKRQIRPCVVVLPEFNSLMEYESKIIPIMVEIATKGIYNMSLVIESGSRFEKIPLIVKSKSNWVVGTKLDWYTSEFIPQNAKGIELERYEFVVVDENTHDGYAIVKPPFISK